jgi:hypothetical protein
MNVTGNIIEATTKNTPPSVTVRVNGDLGNIIAGGNGQDGDLMLFGSGVSGGDLQKPDAANIHLDGGSGHARLGGTTGAAGQLTVKGALPFQGYAIEVGGSGGAQIKMTPMNSPNVSANLDAEKGSLHLRSVMSQADNTIKSGNLTLFDVEGTNHIQLDAESGDITMRGHLANDGSQSGSNLKLLDGHGAQRIHLDGHTGNISLIGDIFLTGGDCAEDFAMATNSAVEPGTVVVIGDEEALVPSNEPYDRKVAGVIAGAGSYQPGIILNRGPRSLEHKPVSLMGRAYCKVDAAYSAIEIGDLLTTSATPGHAMKATDSQRAFGAVIGKALRPIREGRGMIPILIAMQ